MASATICCLVWTRYGCVIFLETEICTLMQLCTVLLLSDGQEFWTCHSDNISPRSLTAKNAPAGHFGWKNALKDANIY